MRRNRGCRYTWVKEEAFEISSYHESAGISRYARHNRLIIHAIGFREFPEPLHHRFALYSVSITGKFNSCILTRENFEEIYKQS